MLQKSGNREDVTFELDFEGQILSRGNNHLGKGMGCLKWCGRSGEGVVREDRVWGGSRGLWVPVARS